MSDLTQRKMDRWLAILAVLAGFGGAFYSLLLLPYKLDAADRQLEVLRREIEDVKTHRETDNAILIRIDQRTLDIEQRVKEISSRQHVVGKVD